MNKGDIEQLRVLLAKMSDPTENEYRKILTEFNKYKEKHNPNFPPPKLTFAKQFYLVEKTYMDFYKLVKLFNAETRSEYKSTINNLLLCLFYEIITTLKTNDLFGYYSMGFTLTDADLEKLKGFRNSIFHVPDDEKIFVERASKFINWKEITATMLSNSVVLNRYFLYYKKNHSKFISHEISNWVVRINVRPDIDSEMLKFIQESDRRITRLKEKGML